MLKRTKEDQDARQKLIELTSRRRDENGKRSNLAASPEFKSLREIDRKNTAWLKMVVNAHGWPVPHGPFGSTVKAIRMVLADGTLMQCSRSEMPTIIK